MKYHGIQNIREIQAYQLVSSHWAVKVSWEKREEQVHSEMDFAISKGINFIDMYASNPDLRSNIGKALTGRRQQFIIQGHLCATWENDQYLRTRDVEKQSLLLKTS